jgi:hypothetical protein
MAKTAQGLKRMVLEKNFVLPIESWVLTLFQIFFLLMKFHDVIFKCDCLDMDMKDLNFFKFFYKNHGIGVFSHNLF